MNHPPLLLCSLCPSCCCELRGREACTVRPLTPCCCWGRVGNRRARRGAPERAMSATRKERRRRDTRANEADQALRPFKLPPLPNHQPPPLSSPPRLLPPSPASSCPSPPVRCSCSPRPCREAARRPLELLPAPELEPPADDGRWLCPPSLSLSPNRPLCLEEAAVAARLEGVVARAQGPLCGRPQALRAVPGDVQPHDRRRVRGRDLPRLLEEPRRRGGLVDAPQPRQGGQCVPPFLLFRASLLPPRLPGRLAKGRRGRPVSTERR